MRSVTALALAVVAACKKTEVAEAPLQPSPSPSAPAIPSDASPAKSGPIRLKVGTPISNDGEVIVFTASRLLITDERGTGAAFVDVDLATGAKKDLYVTPDRIDYVVCTQTASACALELAKPVEGRQRLATNPSRIVVLEGTRATPLAIAGVRDPQLQGISPDGRFVVTNDDKTGLAAVDRTTQHTYPLPTPKGKQLVIDEWRGSSAVVQRTPFGQADPAEYFEWQLAANGAIKPTTSTTSQDRPLISPDGKRTALIHKNESLVIVEGGKRRTLDLAPKDSRVMWPDSCQWIDNRWLGTPLGFIDTDTPTLVRQPLEIDPEHASPIVYAPGSKIAVVRHNQVDELFLATIVGL